MENHTTALHTKSCCANQWFAVIADSAGGISSHFLIIPRHSQIREVQRRRPALTMLKWRFAKTGRRKMSKKSNHRKTVSQLKFKFENVLGTTLNFRQQNMVASTFTTASQIFNSLTSVQWDGILCRGSAFESFKILCVCSTGCKTPQVTFTVSTLQR